MFAEMCGGISAEVMIMASTKKHELKKRQGKCTGGSSDSTLSSRAAAQLAQAFPDNWRLLRDRFPVPGGPTSTSAGQRLAFAG